MAARLSSPLPIRMSRPRAPRLRSLACRPCTRQSSRCSNTRRSTSLTSRRLARRTHQSAGWPPIAVSRSSVRSRSRRRSTRPRRSPRDVGGRVRFMVHENWRFRPHYRRIAGWLREERVGRIRTATMTLLTSGLIVDGSGRAPAIERQPMFATLERLLVMEVVIHHVDTLRFLLGPLTLAQRRDRTIVRAGARRGSRIDVHDDRLWRGGDAHRRFHGPRLARDASRSPAASRHERRDCSRATGCPSFETHMSKKMSRSTSPRTTRRRFATPWRTFSIDSTTAARSRLHRRTTSRRCASSSRCIRRPSRNADPRADSVRDI